MPLRMQRDLHRTSLPVSFRSLGVAFAVAALLSAHVVRAQAPAPVVERGFVNNGWSFGVNGEYSDNAMRTVDDGESETSVAAFTSLDVGYISPRWRLDVIGDLEYRHYIDSLEDDQLLGGGTGRIEFSILEEYLSVFGEDVYGQTQIDATVPDAPSNRGYINSLAYGANGRIPLGSRLSIVGMGAQSRITYDDSDLNYDRTDYSAGLEQRLSDQTRLTLSAMRMRNKFDIDPSVRNYDLEEAWLGLIGEYPRTSIDISVGQTRIKDENPLTPETDEQLLARVSVTRRVGARLEISFDAGTEYSDYAQTSSRQQGFLGAGAVDGNTTVSNDPFKSDYGLLGFEFDGPLYDFTVHYSWRRERHEVQRELDLTHNYADLGVSRSFSTRAEIYIRGFYGRYHYDATDERPIEASVRLGASWRPARQVIIELYGERFTGESTGGDYTENRAGLSIGYASAN